MTATSIIYNDWAAEISKHPIVTILGTKDNAQDWLDVLSVKTDGTIYRIGDLVFMNTKNGGLGKITFFGPVSATIRLVGTEETRQPCYEEIKHVGYKDEHNADPNAAFKKKKKRMF